MLLHFAALLFFHTPPAWHSEASLWFKNLHTPPKPSSLAALLAHAALLQKGMPYAHKPSSENEDPTPLLTAFDCVSLVESSLAIAQCSHQNTPTPDCFEKNLYTWRYRSSNPYEPPEQRLHYFYDWLTHHTQRGALLQPHTPHTQHSPFNFHYISKHPTRFPPLRTRKAQKEILRREQDLTRTGVAWIPKAHAAQTEPLLRTGDILGIVTDKPGIFIAHVGIAWVSHEGSVHLLHASSFHQRVVLTEASLSAYLDANPHRLGFVVFRLHA
jgi:hypothetical protein